MSDQPTEGTEFEYKGGTVETVFAVGEGCVHTVREYPDAVTFEAGIAEAVQQGSNEEVADLAAGPFRREE